MHKRFAILLLWLFGILFPLAGLRRFSTLYQGAFDLVFGPPWMHVMMHLALYAGLVILLLATFHFRNPRLAFLVAGGAALGVGVLQEGLQAHSAGFLHLPGAAFDLGVDLTGGMAGLAVAWLWARRYELN